jgi:ADP-dependent phosphofructokinase/glucokinase
MEKPEREIKPLLFRMTPETHKKLKMFAAEAEMTMTAFLEKLINDYEDRKTTKNFIEARNKDLGQYGTDKFFPELMKNDF